MLLAQSPPAPWQTTDIGSVGITGVSSYEPATGEYPTFTPGTYTVRGSGAWIYFTSDSFRYMYQSAGENALVVARISSADWTSGGNTMKAGVMFRETLSPGARNVMLTLHRNFPSSPVLEMQYRDNTNGDSSVVWGPALAAPVWLKLQRAGSTFTGYWSSDGRSWSLLWTKTLAMAQQVTGGIAVSSEDNSRLASATFTNVGVGPTPPTTWKGINYTPRLHSYPRMLFDWYNYQLRPAVSSDLATLQANGFNLLHLYLWDRALLRRVSPGNAEASGFYSCLVGPFADITEDPGSSLYNQWMALDEFLAEASAKGFYVALHFANGCVKDYVRSGAYTPAVTAERYASWMKRFVYQFSGHRNIAMWGLNWAWDPIDNSGEGLSREVWRLSYEKLDAYAKDASPLPNHLGLIGVSLTFHVIDPATGLAPSDIIPRGSGYQWQVSQARSLVADMFTLLQREPDLFMPNLYTANTTDLQVAVDGLTSPFGGGRRVPVEKIFVNEFATSNSLEGGTGVASASIEDSQTPTTGWLGQAQWTKNALCAYWSRGIKKYAYWAMYDPFTFWSTYPWSLTGTDLAWRGFWGLFNEYGTAKAVWDSVRLFDPSQPTQSCPSIPPPVAGLRLEGLYYYTVNLPISLSWTLADTSSLSLSHYADSHRSCLPNPHYLPIPGLASCVHAWAYSYTQGPQNVTLTAGNGSTYSALSVPITVGASPLVNAVTDANYTSYITPTSILVVWGVGFSPIGANWLKFTRPGYSDVWMWPGDGHYMWGQSYFQINAAIDSRLTSGQWNLQVYNGHTSTPSAPFAVTIY